MLFCLRYIRLSAPISHADVSLHLLLAFPEYPREDVYLGVEHHALLAWVDALLHELFVFGAAFDVHRAYLSGAFDVLEVALAVVACVYDVLLSHCHRLLRRNFLQLNYIIFAQ